MPATGYYRASHLDALLRARGIRRTWFAAEVGVSRSALHHYLSGRRPIPPRVVAACCRLLGVPEGVLFYDPVRPRRRDKRGEIAHGRARPAGAARGQRAA